MDRGDVGLPGVKPARIWLSLAVLVLLVAAGSAGCRLPSFGDSSWSPANLFGGGDSSKTRFKPKREESDEPMWGEKSPDRLMWEDLSPNQLWTTVQSAFSTKEDREAAEQLFARGKSEYEEACRLREADPEDPAAGEAYAKAADHLQLAAKRWPDSALEHDALFLLGEANFFADRYVLANRAYEQLLDRYSGTKHLDLVEARRFSIAQYWLNLSREQSPLTLGYSFGDEKRPTNDLAGQARRVFHRIRMDDPTGKLADDATLALANAHFEAENYREAADTYEDLRRTYPGSSHQFHAHLLELKSRLKAYQGPSYDGTPLRRADELLKTIVRQFPAEAAEHHDYLAQEGARVRHLLAERDWKMARFFERRGENRAAQFYYNRIVEDYSDTELAADSREREEQLRDKPPHPAQQAAWLVNLFPEPKATKPLISPSDSETVFR